MFGRKQPLDTQREVTEGHVRSLGKEDTRKVADVVGEPACRFLQPDQGVYQGSRVIHQVAHESLFQRVVGG